AGPVGAGHYAKMVHNGIEYGLMHAYAEGYELLEASEYVTDVPAVVKSWREGTVIRSWLLDLLDRALEEDPKLAQLRGYADDTGEGRWTVEESIRLAVPMNVIAASLFARFLSRQDDSPAMKAAAARGTRRAAHGAVRAGGPGPGTGGSGRAAALPRRPAGRAAATVRRGTGGLRAGAQAAQRPAAHRVPRPQGRRRCAGPVHIG